MKYLYKSEDQKLQFDSQRLWAAESAMLAVSFVSASSRRLIKTLFLLTMNKISLQKFKKFEFRPQRESRVSVWIPSKQTAAVRCFLSEVWKLPPLSDWSTDQKPLLLADTSPRWIMVYVVDCCSKINVYNFCLKDPLQNTQILHPVTLNWFVV